MKTPTPAEYRQTYLEAMSPHVPEPILELGFLSKAGLVNSYKADALTGKALYQISPLANRFFHKQKKQSHAKTVSNQLVAVTATSVFLFDFIQDGQPFTVTQAPTEWRRATIRVTAEDQKKLSQRIHVEFSTGESLEFDINRSAGPWATFNEPMRDLLMQNP